MPFPKEMSNKTKTKKKLKNKAFLQDSKYARICWNQAKTANTISAIMGIREKKFGTSFSKLHQLRGIAVQENA